MANMNNAKQPHVVQGTYTTKAGFTTQKSLKYCDSLDEAESYAATLSPGTWVSPTGKTWTFSEIRVRPMGWL